MFFSRRVAPYRSLPSCGDFSWLIEADLVHVDCHFARHSPLYHEAREIWGRASALMSVQ